MRLRELARRLTRVVDRDGRPGGALVWTRRSTPRNSYVCKSRRRIAVGHRGAWDVLAAWILPRRIALRMSASARTGRVPHRAVLARRPTVIFAVVAAVAFGRPHVAAAGSVGTLMVGHDTVGLHDCLPRSTVCVPLSRSRKVSIRAAPCSRDKIDPRSFEGCRTTLHCGISEAADGGRKAAWRSVGGSPRRLRRARATRIVSPRRDF